MRFVIATLQEVMDSQHKVSKVEHSIWTTLVNQDATIRLKVSEYRSITILRSIQTERVAVCSSCWFFLMYVSFQFRLA